MLEDSQKIIKYSLGRLNSEEQALKALKKILFFFLPDDCVKGAANQKLYIVTMR